jgi:hypothetical protein
MKVKITEIDHQADQLIDQVRGDIETACPELDSDVVDEMVLIVIQTAIKMIEQQNKKA